MLATVGEQDVVAANGAVSIAGLHVAKVVAGLVVLDVVLEGVLGRLGVSVGVGVVVPVGTGTAAARTRRGTVLGGGRRGVVVPAVIVCVIVVTVIPILVRGQVVAARRWRLGTAGGQDGQRDDGDGDEDLAERF